MTTAFTATQDRIGYLVEQARDTSADLIAVLLKSGGESKGALAGRATLAAVLTGTSEADFTNYDPITLSGPTRSVDTSADRVLLTVDSPITWLNAGGTIDNTLAYILYCYSPAAGSTNAQILPLMATSISATTNGNDLQVTVHADGFAVVEQGA